MPPKIARKLTVAETQRAIAKTQDNESSQVGEDTIENDQETQVDDGNQPDQETQVDDTTQSDADAPTSSADSNGVNDAMTSTADGPDAATPNTPATSTHEVETKAAIKTATKRPAGKKVATGDDQTGDGTKRKRRVKRDPTNFQAYIHKVLRQIHPDSSMSKTAMQIMNDFIKDVCIRIADLASDLCKKLKKSTLQAHDIQTAAKLILTGGLADHAQREATKALRIFNKATKQDLR
ncbi:hypothetical protein QM012_007981 [Aureobasidium pullulans]|uniref:Histone H2B n=1 Tax=Aureobasidium pullulans TaxID=5580 RepID=A0ABR0TLI2_AURPU